MSDEVTAPEEQKKEEERPEEAVGLDLPGILRSTDGAPTQEEIDKWKAEYGDIFVSAFSDTELFVFRAITRGEWVELQKQLSQQEGGFSQYDIEDALSQTCVLWTSAPNSVMGKAGTLSVLNEWIMSQSNFMNPAQAAALVAKL